MRFAIGLGKRGLGRTSPNPPVGAVILDNGKIIGKGYHHKAGAPHAEIEAIEDARANGYTDFSSATMYVTLEPCCYFGKTPPCIDRIIQENFARVVIGTTDPNPKVSGKSIKKLKSTGIDVSVGVLQKQAERLVEHFRIYITRNRAYLAAKFAQSLDGKIAAQDGSSQWISSEKSLRFAHYLRDTHDAVMIGVGTLKNDDPQLTVRYVEGRNPVRIVVGGNDIINGQHTLFGDNSAHTILISPRENPLKPLPKSDKVEIWPAPSDERGYVPIRWILEKLAERDIISVLLEGGSKIFASAIAEDMVDRIYAIIAPKLIGSSGIDAIGAEVSTTIGDAIELEEVEYRRMGKDMILTGSMPNHK